MPNYAKLAKGLTSAIKGTQDVLPAAERQANLNKFLEKSAIKQRVYHGTGGDFSAFDLKEFGKTDKGWAGKGFYFAPDPHDASMYALHGGIKPGQERQANVMPVHLNISNPLRWELGTPEGRQIQLQHSALGPDGFRDWLIKNGYDGVNITSKRGDNQWVALHPEQVKSATGNKGTYDVTKPDINEAKGGSVKMAAGGVSKAAKAITSLLKGTQDVLPAAEREANLAKFLEQSKTPMRLYHGTTATEAGKGQEAIRRFKPSKEGALGSGVYLTPSPAKASRYSGSPNEEMLAEMKKGAGVPDQVFTDLAAGKFRPDVFGPQEGGNMLPVYAQLRNPLIIEGKHGDPMIEALMKLGMDESKAAKMVERAYENKGYIGKEVENRARAAGYDGLMQYRNGELGEVVSYNPNAVKSAIGNKGTYDVYNQDLNQARGGAVRMSEGGGKFKGKAKLLEGGLKAVKRLFSDEPVITENALRKADEATLRAKGLGVPGVDFADPLKAPSMRMSEALGNVGAEGKTLNFTEADRSRVFGPNRGGVGFSALQHYSEPHKEARTVWGFGNESVAKKKINQNDPDNTIWTTYAGSPEQHKSNTVVVKDAIKTLQEANKAGAIHPEQVRLINQRINQAVNDNGKPLFPAGFDITDPQALSAATTFDRRAVISDALMGIGVKKPMISKEFKEANPGVKWKDASNIGGILARETDPALVNAKTFDVGPNLFVMDNKIIHRPDLNEAFPVQVTGEDLGMRFNLAPFRNAAPDFIKKKGYGPNDPINAWAMSRGVPSQFVNETYLTDLQKAGYKDGGEVSDSFANRWKAALEAHMADGGEVGNWQDALAQRDSSFADRLKSALEQHMAEGGEVSDNTTPDMTDGGNVNYAEGFAEGGAPQSPEEPLSASDAPVAPEMRQMFSKAIAKGKKALEAEYNLLKDPTTRADILKRIGLQALGSGTMIPGSLMGSVGALKEEAMAPVAKLLRRSPGTAEGRIGEVTGEALGGDRLIEEAKKRGSIGEAEAPIAEFAASLAAPFAVGPAVKAAKAAPTVAKKLVNEMLTPMSPRAAQRGSISLGNVPQEGASTTGAAYATKQEGPFFRVSPVASGASPAAGRGIREADELQGQTSLGGGAGQAGSQVPTRLSDEEVARIISDPAANEPLNIAKKYTQETQGAEFVLPEIPESSLVKQSAIGRAHQLAVEGTPQYKSAVFDAYAREMPEVLEQSGAKNYDDLMEKAYRQLAKETDAQFQALPYNFSYHRAGEGNYQSSKEMVADVHGNKHLYVFQGGDPHDFLNRIDPVTGLNENEKFRAVHDLLGHAIYGNQFGPKGEEVAWAIHSQMYSPLARLAMTAETRGQNSMVNYSPLNANLKAEIAKYDSMADEARRRGDKGLLNEINAAKRQAYSGFQFAPQKAVLLPPEFLSSKYSGGMPSYLESANLPVKGTETQSALTHFSNRPDLQFVDPRKYGTGIKGAEADRLKNLPGGVRDRAYFYMGEPGSVTPEPGLGVNRYLGESSSLYDITQDPLNFRVLSREANRVPYTAKYNQGITNPLQEANDMERLVKEYGYQGMANPKSSKPMAIMFKETPVIKKSRGGLAQAKG